MEAERRGGRPFVYTRCEAARELRVCPRTLDKLIRRGEIRIRRIGNRVLITEQALREFLGDRVPRRAPSFVRHSLGRQGPHEVQ